MTPEQRKLIHGNLLHTMSDLTDKEQEAIRALIKERDTLAASYAEEKKIVDRIWEQLGSPTYEQLAGRSIYDLIGAALAENVRLKILYEATAANYCREHEDNVRLEERVKVLEGLDRPICSFVCPICQDHVSGRLSAPAKESQ